MTIEHKNIADAVAGIHKPAGFTAAANETVVTKDGAGAIEWLGGANDSVLTLNSSGALVFEDKSAITGDLPHGHSYISTPAATTVTTGATYYQVAGTWTNTEANSITWDTDHFVITVAGAYLVHLVGSALMTATSILSLDMNMESTIATGSVQGFVPLRAQAQVGATLIAPIGCTFYLDDLEVDDLITPMVTHETGNDGDAVTAQVQMFIGLVHS